MVDAGITVLVRVAPGVRAKLLDVRAAPFLVFTHWLFQENLQTLFHARITVHVDIKPLESRLQFGHVTLGRADFGIVGRPHELGDDGGGENPDHDNHHHHFDQGESRRPLLKRMLFHITILHFLRETLRSFINSCRPRGFLPM